METKSRRVGARGGGGGSEEWRVVKGYKVSVLQDVESSGDLLHDNTNILNTPELYIKKWLRW